MKKAILCLAYAVLSLSFLKAGNNSLIDVATLSATSTNANYSIMNIRDNNETSSWRSASGGSQYIYITLSQEVRFFTIKLSNVSAYDGYKIEVSPDNVSWYEKGSYDPNSIGLFTVIKTNIFCAVKNEFKPIKYIRVLFGAYQGYAQIGEICITEDLTLFKSFSLSSNYINPLYIFDNDLNTAATNNYGGARVFSITFKEQLQVAKVSLKTNKAGFSVDLYNGTTCTQKGYFYTFGGVEDFLIVAPDNFDKVEFNTALDIPIYDIQVEKKKLFSTSIYYAYDDGGNMTYRTILLPTVQDEKIKENDTIIQCDLDPEPLEDKFLTETFQIYPNPTRGQLNVVCKYLDATKTAQISITNLSGVQIAQSSLKNCEATLNIGLQPAGTYLMNIQVGDENHQWTIIKK